MLQLSDLPVDVRLEKWDLHLLLNQGLQKLANKPIEVNMPILGEVTILFYNFDLQSVVPKIGQCLIHLRVAVKIDPASRMVSPISGVLQLSSLVAVLIDQDAVSIDFRVENFQWLEGPHIEESGKHLGVVEKISSVLFNQFNFIEERISRKLEDALKPEHLTALLLSLPDSFDLPGIKIHLSRTKLVIHHFLFGDGYLSLGITAGLEINPEDPASRETKIAYAESRRKDVPVRLKISHRMINAILPSQLDRINQLIRKLPIGIKNLEIKMHMGELRAYLWPDRLLNDPVIAVLSVRFNEETREIFLDEFDLGSEVKTSAMTRGILKIVRQRMEKTIRQHFPMKTDLMLEQYLSKIEDVEIPGIPLEIHLQGSRLLDLQLNEGTMTIVLDTKLYLASNTDLSQQQNRT